MPDGMDVNVVENTDNTVHITMPQAPAGDGDLSDEELTNVAGGFPSPPPVMIDVPRENTDNIFLEKAHD